MNETEQATLTVSVSLDQISRAGQAFIADIRDRLGELEVEGEEGVSGKLERQCGLVTDFLGQIRECVQMQRDASERMLATSHKVAAAAESVSQISIASRVLCLNTMIEAGRLGEIGQPMIVIADQMRALSDQIGKSNEEISSSIASLLPTLEDVGSSSSQVDERATAFSAEFEVQAAAVGDIAGKLRDTARAALEGGDDQLETIIENSRNAVLSLQTQDLISQRLRRVLQLLDRSGTNTDVQDDGSAVALDDAASQSEPADQDVYLSDSLGGDGERELESGDVMLF